MPDRDPAPDHSSAGRPTSADLHFYFDPVCPFAWMTSTWVRQVAAQRDYAVEWRFVSLRLLNASVDYDSHFPPEYEAGHTAGLHLLRVAAQVRHDHGPDGVARLYSALGRHVWERPGGTDDLPRRTADGSLLRAVLPDAGLPLELAAAREDAGWDVEIAAETDEALSLTGKDVGTPILHFRPPDGVAFFGPVISRRPSDAEALELWDHVLGLTRFPGFAELKRSLRERPQLGALGVPPGEVGAEEDWHAGSRRLKR